MIQILLVIPVAIAFYYFGKWLRESEKRDDEKRKIEEQKKSKLDYAIKKESELQKVLSPILNVVLIIILIIVLLYFIITFITSSSAPYGDCGEYGCEPLEYAK